MPASKKRRADEGPELAPINGHRHLLGGGGATALAAGAADSRRKRSAASRIGRACDRCQHRKLACDPAPGGCPPCQKVNAWCTVTDPLTGTPTYRGEFEYLEQRVAKQQRDIEALLAKLRNMGQDASDCVPEETAEDRRYTAWIQVKASGDTRPWDRDERNSSVARRNGPPPIQTMQSYDGNVSQDRHTSAGTTSKRSSTSPDLPEPLAPESYVGVATSRGHPVSSRLNMFGWEIDLADFTTPDADDFGQSPDPDNLVYDRSYRGSFASIYGLQPRQREPDLPPKAQFMHYAQAIIGVLNPYTPILHKNKFMAMVDQVYDRPEVEPSVVQKSILHMVCANVLMHMAVRNQDPQKAQTDESANQHYHYVLGHFGKLLSGDTIEHVQALALVCLFTRNFPKPEMCWAVSHRTLARLIELSYHRAPNKKRRGSDDLSIYEAEMQKRLFWVILICAVNMSGKLGRPMPLRAEDFDVDIPSSIPDDALTEAGIDEKIRQEPCDFKPHIELSKLTPIYMEVYSTIYTAKRSNADYRTFVDSIESKLKKWQEQWPDEYQNPGKANELDKMSVSFLNFFVFELKLLLHHPSLSMTRDGHPNHDDLRICLQVSHGMLQNVKEMQRLRALEGTWHNCSVFMLAIQTTLYGHKMLKDEMTTKRLEELKGDMRAWLSIIGDMGTLIGSGDKLQHSVRIQIENGLFPLQQHFQSKPARNVPAPLHKQENYQPEIKVEQLSTPSTASSHTSQLNNQYAAYGTAAGTPPGPTATTNYQQLPSPNYQSQVYQQMHQQQQQQHQQQQPSYPYPEHSPTNAPTSYPSNAPSLPANYPNVGNGNYITSLSAPNPLTPHAGPATVNGYGSQQQQQQQQQQQHHHQHPQAAPSPQTHGYANGYYPTYSPQQATSSDPPTSWLQYTQAIHHGASASRSPQPGASGSGTGNDFQPAAASALLQLGGNGVGFDSLSQWPMGFISDRNGFDGRRG